MPAAGRSKNLLRSITVRISPRRLMMPRTNAGRAGHRRELAQQADFADLRERKGVALAGEIELHDLERFAGSRDRLRRSGPAPARGLSGCAVRPPREGANCVLDAQRGRRRGGGGFPSSRSVRAASCEGLLHRGEDRQQASGGDAVGLGQHELPARRRRAAASGRWQRSARHPRVRPCRSSRWPSAKCATTKSGSR